MACQEAPEGRQSGERAGDAVTALKTAVAAAEWALLLRLELVGDADGQPTPSADQLRAAADEAGERFDAAVAGLPAEASAATTPNLAYVTHLAAALAGSTLCEHSRPGRSPLPVLLLVDEGRGDCPDCSPMATTADETASCAWCGSEDDLRHVLVRLGRFTAYGATCRLCRTQLGAAE